MWRHLAAEPKKTVQLLPGVFVSILVGTTYQFRANSNAVDSGRRDHAAVAPRRGGGVAGAHLDAHRLTVPDESRAQLSEQVPRYGSSGR
jgi:hypothetical protein